jgi:hypothetical protein
MPSAPDGLAVTGLNAGASGSVGSRYIMSYSR